MISEIIVIATTGVIALASAIYGREPKVNQCIIAYGNCVAADQTEARCQTILRLCDKPKKQKESEACYE